MKERYRLLLQLDNLTDAQVIAFVKMINWIEACGKVGTSRWISFFADGDGDCRIRSSYNIYGNKELSDKLTNLIDNHTFNYDFKLDDDYSEHKDIKIDYDKYAWELNDIENEKFS